MKPKQLIEKRFRGTKIARSGPGYAAGGSVAIADTVEQFPEMFCSMFVEQETLENPKLFAASIKPWRLVDGNSVVFQIEQNRISWTVFADEHTPALRGSFFLKTSLGDCQERRFAFPFKQVLDLLSGAGDIESVGFSLDGHLLVVAKKRSFVLARLSKEPKSGPVKSRDWKGEGICRGKSYGSNPFGPPSTSISAKDRKRFPVAPEPVPGDTTPIIDHWKLENGEWVEDPRP